MGNNDGSEIMSIERSPLAPDRFPEMPAVPGLRLAAMAAALRYRDRDDLALFAFAPGTSVGGVFTKSCLPGHPISWCKRILNEGKGQARGLVVNAGNANVLTGQAGDEAVLKEANAAAELLGAPSYEIYVASTGVIGEPLPADKIAAALPALHEKLDDRAWEAVANAICTTDTFPKGACRQTTIEGQAVTIAGIAKGSGMIQPDMATMLAYIVTDASLSPPLVQALVEDANEQAFRRITVDSDTSTSDMLLLFATGQAPHPTPLSEDDPALDEFREALREVAVDLAKQVVRDGEGATKLIKIQVDGAVSNDSARIIGFAIANSPLVKTAIAGEDANWGRIAMAIGKAYEVIDVEQLGISVGGHAVANGGARVVDLDEGPITAHLQSRDIRIDVKVGRGPGSSTVWTSDLTHGYISINADYRS